MAQLGYTPGINVRPVSTALPTKLGAIPTTAPRTAQQQAFNMPAYLRNNTTAGQWDELNRANQDRYRADLSRGQSTMGRQMQQANLGHMFDTLQSATGAANNYYDTMSNAIQGDRQNQAGWITGLGQLNANRMNTFMPFLGGFMQGW